MKIEIKNRYDGSVIYSHECEGNTIKKTVEKAVKENANLENANLENAVLENAYLGNANLRDAKNKDEAVKVPMYCKWSHGVTNGSLIQIGCKKRTIEDWDKFFSSNEEIETKRNTPEFKQIQAVYEAYKAYLTFLTE